MSIEHSNVVGISQETLDYTPDNVTDSCLVVVVSSEDVSNDEPITGVSFGASAMTLEAIGEGINGSHSNDVVIAYLVNPGTTEKTISVTGGQQSRMGIVALTLDEVDQVNPVDTSNDSAYTSGNSCDVSATTGNAGSYAISAICTDDSGHNLSFTGATEIHDRNPTSSSLGVGAQEIAVAGAYTHTVGTVDNVGRAGLATVAFNKASSGGGAAEFAAAITGSTSLVGDLTTSLRLAASISGASSSTALLTSLIQLNASLNSSSSVSGVLSSGDSLFLAGNVSGTTSSTGALNTGILFQGDLAGSAEVTADLLSTILLVASGEGSSISQGSLQTAISLLGDADGSSTVDAQVTTAVQLAASLVGSSTASGDFEQLTELLGALSGGSVSTADLLTAINLASHTNNPSAVTGLLVGGTSSQVSQVNSYSPALPPPVRSQELQEALKYIYDELLRISSNIS